LKVRKRATGAALALVCLALCACGGTQGPATPAAGSGGSAPSAQASSVAESRSPYRYNLERDEERGGHTLKKHVGRTDQELLERLDRSDHHSDHG